MKRICWHILDLVCCAHCFFAGRILGDSLSESWSCARACRKVKARFPESA